MMEDVINTPNEDIQAPAVPQVAPEHEIQVQIYIPASIHAQLKILAASRQTSLAKYAVFALAEHVNSKEIKISEKEGA